MLKDPRTYEIMRPQDVGQTAEQLVLGRHSGRHAVQRRCETLGFALTIEELGHVYHAVITIGEHRKSIGDGDLRRIVERVRTPARRRRGFGSLRNDRLSARTLSLQFTLPGAQFSVRVHVRFCVLVLRSTFGVLKASTV